MKKYVWENNVTGYSGSFGCRYRNNETGDDIFVIGKLESPQLKLCFNEIMFCDKDGEKVSSMEKIHTFELPYERLKDADRYKKFYVIYYRNENCFLPQFFAEFDIKQFGKYIRKFIKTRNKYNDFLKEKSL